MAEKNENNKDSQKGQVTPKIFFLISDSSGISFKVGYCQPMVLERYAEQIKKWSVECPNLLQVYL